jgi:hypothetical protein
MLTSSIATVRLKKAAYVKQVVSSVDCPCLLATWRQRFVELGLNKARCIKSYTEPSDYVVSCFVSPSYPFTTVTNGYKRIIFALPVRIPAL